MEIEESEIFEITDYTNVTAWETFISKIEEIITLFDNSQLNEIIDKIESHKITFQKFELNIFLYQPKLICLDKSSSVNADNSNNSISIAESLILRENKNYPSDTENDIHWELVKWFGKRKFIVFTPSKSTSIYGQDQINQLISSITIAAINIKCQLPIVIKYGPKNWPLYSGIQFDNDLRCKLQFATIKYTPKQCNNLSGIRRLFQEKLGKGYVFNDDDINLTAKYLYLIENHPHKNGNYFQGIISPSKKMHFFQYMSVGFAKDPIKNTKIFLHWPKVPKNILIHIDYQSLPVSSADCWFVSCESENSYDGILYKTLRKLLKSFLVAQKSGDILQENKSQDIDTMQINQPLLKLTKFPISNHHLFEKSFGNQAKVDKDNNSNKSDLLTGKTLQDILLFIFPDARQDGREYDQNSYIINENLKIPNYDKLLKRYPNANLKFLIHRIAVCLTNLLAYHKEGMKCFSFIWMEIVLELRYRLEKGVPLPDTKMSRDFKLIENENTENKDEIFDRLLRESMPHLGSSQLEQRLQLINYCILTRLRNQLLQNYDCASDSYDSDETMEQFFDCETDNDNDSPIDNTLKIGQESRGRLRKCGDLKLINYPDVPLYVPITQVLSVDVYSGSKQAKHDQSLEFLEHYHSASLVADMSAFKAANPGCVVEDFIRWYSPKDFIEDESKGDKVTDNTTEVKGVLSSRMLATDNTWLKSWRKAIPNPARLQKRLFDDTIAAETALKWMDNLTSAEISSNLINNVLIDSLKAVVECIDEQDPPEFLHQIDNASLAMMKFFEKIDVMDITGAELEYYQPYDELISHFQQIEYSLTVKKSLYHKFFRDISGANIDKEKVISLINQLLVSKYEVAISKQNLSGTTYEYVLDRLMSMYKITHLMDTEEVNKNVDQILTEAHQKEYLLSLNCSYPFPTSRKSDQRLYVCSSDNEFLVASNFCEDITYF